MTYQLPNELKIKIIQHVDKKSLPAVLRVDSTFRDIAEALLYHTILLDPRQHQLLGAATKCLNTIIGRPSSAAAVRCMGVKLYGWNGVGAEEFLEAFRTALPKIPNLVELEILKSRHFVSGEVNISRLPQGCLFPTLQHYYGPPILDDIRSNVLKTLRIYSMRSSITLIQRSCSAAARLSGQTLRTLAIHESRGGQGDLGEWEGMFVEIPSHFPNLRHLSVEPGHPVSFALIDKLIPNIVRLPKLRLLQVYNSEEMQRSEQERYVKHLHAGCPQLRAITLSEFDEWMFCERLQTWVSGGELNKQLWEEVDWRNYLEDPNREGFDYTAFAFRYRWQKS